MAVKETELTRDDKVSLNTFHGEAVASSVENAAIAYQSASLIDFGAEAKDLSFLSFLTNILFSFFCISAPSIVQRMGPAKRMTVLLAVANVVTWIPIAVIFVLGIKCSPTLLIILWVLNVLPSLLCGPLRDSWLADMLPADKVGRYLGMRALVSGAAYIGSFYVMGLILDHAVGFGLSGFAVIFGIATLAASGYTLLFRVIKPPSIPVEQGNTNFSLGEFFEEITTQHLGKLILFVALFQMAVNLAGPLFSIYMLKDLSFTYTTFTIIVTAEYAARIVSSRFWGKYADRKNNVHVLSIICKLIPIIPIIWLFSSNITYLVIAQVFSGVLWAGFDLNIQTIIYRQAAPENRLKFIIYHRSLGMLGAGLGSLAGAYLLTFMVPVFGSSILGLFLLSGICRFLVVKIMFRRLVTEQHAARPFEQPLPGWVTWLASNPGRALLHEPREWSHFVEPVTRQTMVKSTPETKGVFYRPTDWKQFTGKVEKEPLMAATKLNAPEPTKHALYYRPETWQPMPETATNNAGKNGSTKTPHFYHPENWEVFTASQAAKIETPKCIAVGCAKTGLLHRPEQWTRFTETPEKQPANKTAYPKLRRHLSTQTA